jgi:hypothetical protein
MAELNTKQIDAIMVSLSELEDFKNKVRIALKSKKISQYDLNEVEANLRYIESNTAYIIDLLGSKD